MLFENACPKQVLSNPKNSQFTIDFNAPIITLRIDLSSLT